MAEILAFPKKSDRDLVQDAIGKCARSRMHVSARNLIIAEVLRGLKIEKLRFEGYFVQDMGDWENRLGTHPIIHIEGTRKSLDGRCPVPVCRAAGGLYVNGDEEVTMFCPACGCVYTRDLLEEIGL